MAITELPVLPEEYPLFDWADWPNSYAALVQGGPTKAFEKDCWNGIVDYMAEVVEASGLLWLDGTQDPEYIQMSGEGNIRFKAQMFNILMRAVDKVIELPWRWEFDTAFRGYIGRQFFHFDINMERDTVYPEYFTELIVHINRVVELLRGTVETSAVEAEQESFSISTAAAEKKTAGTLKLPKITSGTAFNTAAEMMILGELIDFPKFSTHSHTSNPTILIGSTIYKRLRTGTMVRSSGEILESGSVAGQLPIFSLHAAAIDALQELVEMAEALLLVSSASSADMGLLSPQAASEAQKSMTHTGAEMVQKPAQELPGASATGKFTVSRPMAQLISADAMGEAKVLSHLTMSAEAADSQSLPIAAGYLAESGSEASADQLPSLPGSSTRKTASQTFANMAAGTGAAMEPTQSSAVAVAAPVLLYSTAPVFSEKASEAAVRCSLDINGWEYPVWMDGGLWIRQAYSIEQAESGEMEVR